jgi:hypothetical protein
MIFVGHGHGSGNGYVHDHRSLLPLGTSVHRGKAPLSVAFRGGAALVAGSR